MEWVKGCQGNGFSGVWNAGFRGLGLTPKATGCHQRLPTWRGTQMTLEQEVRRGLGVVRVHRGEAEPVGWKRRDSLEVRRSHQLDWRGR